MRDLTSKIYLLSVEDVQHVAMEEYGRTLTDEEIEIVEENVGDYIKWYDIIEMTIENHVMNPIEIYYAGEKDQLST